MVEWLEQLDYGAERRSKIVLRHLTTGYSVNPAVDGYLFRIREGLDSEKNGMGSALHQLCPRYNGNLTPTVPTAIRL